MKLKETIMIAIAALAFMLITGIAKANPVLNWFEAEKQKTIEYQKKSWANTKEDFASLVKKFGLLGKKKDESQN
tara:strand:+ start:237 stop:458 length:222 start_codon:yes stop_codon:yes gene_type:complete